MSHHTQLVFVFFVEMRSPRVAGSSLKLLGSSNPLALVSQSAEITGVSHCTSQACFLILQFYLLENVTSM